MEESNNNMENEILTANYRPSILQRLIPAAVPVLLIAIGYVDPGKWAAAVEGGAHFGVDLVAPMLVFNFAAIFCQYLSARITVVTGKDLAQICSEEYDMATCIFLGVQTEFSMIALDLTMILGTAHGLNLIFGVDLFTCVFLTLLDAVLFPLFATFLENGKARFLCIGMASFIMLSYIFGILISQQETPPISMNGMPTKFSGESAFALMSLLGASIMPHNFYLHSSLVQQDVGPPNVSKRAVCHDHFFAILCIFSGIFMVNYVLMNSAANIFYSTGLVLITFQDALSLMDQVLRSPLAPFALILGLLFSNQIRALTWNLGRQAVLHDFFRIDIPGWLHHATIRIIAIVPALYCVWNSGAEGIYQLLIFIQVVVALVLPSSVIPLFRVASSRSIMGAYKISQFLEFMALISFIGMLGLNIIFVVEMIFGNSDWVGNLRWNLGSSISVPYVVLLITASVTLCLMIWLAATPLKSACSRLDAQVWDWDIQNAVPEPYAKKDDTDFIETRYHGDQSIQRQEPRLALGNSLDNHLDMSVTSADLNLPETLLDSDNVRHLTTIDESCSNTTFPGPSVCHPGESVTKIEIVPVTSVCSEVFDSESLDTSTSKTESTDLVEKTVRVEGDLQSEKDDEGDTWEPEESSKRMSGSSPSLTSEGPGSFRSLSGKSDDGGSGAGSLSRLAGLGRAARRQLAAILDEFWGQLYDFHGQVTQEAKAKKLDVLLGVDSKVDPKPATTLKVDMGGKELTGYYPSIGGRGSDSMISSNLYDSTKQHGLQRSIESSVQRGSSSLWSNHMQMLDAYVQNSSRNALDAGERRYSSLRLPPSSDGYDYQPATVHGYQIASYLNRIAKEKSSDYLNGQMESMTPKSPSLGTSNYKGSLSFALGQKPENGISASRPPGFPNLAVPRNSSLQSERPSYDNCSSRPAENVGGTVDAKKFYSLPDIAGLLPHRNSHLSDKNARWDSTIGYRPSVGQKMYEQSPSSSTSSWAQAPSTFDELSSSKVCRDAFSLQFSSRSDTGSLWTRQPYEQFGVADKIHATGGEGVGSRQTSINQETTSAVDLEAKLLQSFRYCIAKLLKLEGSDWLFRQNDGADEDLIDRVAARERFLYEAETREMNRGVHMGEFQYSSDRKPGFTLKNDDTDITKFLVSSVPQCGEGCIWRGDLIISFGVWCIHRVLELSLMESRPELWGKYTYVLNRLQGIIDLAFSKPRCPMAPCFCLQIPVAYQQRSSPPISNESLPPPVQQGRGKCTNAVMLLEIIKDVELAISCRKGRTGTAAGDVAFPKGKENLVSVLKRYKRRLSNKPVATHEGVSVSRKASASASYGL
ncbi:ethylene-insensitive protein 2.2-like [Cornus florida]|uniref:ethylene-insensitive protein 2.2-like n=1 Tax=Cornus florida TaxID=4283 RepID=UPI00289E8ED7|nr:ethylene-insensitive protein 2.2-like [Cornus florida]XP_059667631.1 ethylene-insensitive protein 2.2-like [Cornus florida]XP_059667633.1 ethylene-insensitive protein 2.2-like [Cornus florida]